jgi:hypothetical protein
MVPTWRNGRQGQDAIARRLDRCLVVESLLLDSGYYRSWVELPFVSDLAPVLLQLFLPPAFKVFPFKFNEQWLGDKDFAVLVERVWKSPIYLSETSSQRG